LHRYLKIQLPYDHAHDGPLLLGTVPRAYGNEEIRAISILSPVLRQNIMHMAYESHVVSVIDYNISLFRTASRSNYAIIDYTMLQSASVVIFRNGIFHW
jgi:hypothetical protein